MTKDVFIGIRIESDLAEWIGNENKSKKIRKILKWCKESYPNINRLFELMKK